MENEFNQELIEYWRKIDVAIMGIGSPNFKASESWKQFYGEDVLAYLEGKKVVGDVVSRFYNIEGDHIENTLDERLIGIDITDLKRIPYRIGVAESLNKADAIASALKGCYINVLVTTEETAQEVLKR
ncbi:sugar-binding domain-containing protein [Enterococcus faecium]